MRRREFLALLGLLAWSPAALAAEPPVARQVRMGLVVSNPGDDILSGETLWVYGPVARTSFQQVIGLEASHSYRLQKDTLGNQVLVFPLPDLPPYSTTVIRIRADLLVTEVPQPAADAAPFLAAEPFIESGHPEVQAAARALQADGAPAPRAVYEWVTRHLHYAGFVAEDLGALQALRSGRGDCTEYAALFAALLRAQGVPARVLGGYQVPAGGILRAGQYHNWAEYYADGRWHLADPQRENFRTRQSEYVAFRIVSAAEPGAAGSAHRYRATPGVVVTME